MANIMYTGGDLTGNRPCFKFIDLGQSYWENDEKRFLARPNNPGNTETRGSLAFRPPFVQVTKLLSRTP